MHKLKSQLKSKTYVMLILNSLTSKLRKPHVRLNFEADFLATSTSLFFFTHLFSFTAIWLGLRPTLKGIFLVKT